MTPEPPRERTEAEREAARLEREERRKARESSRSVGGTPERKAGGPSLPERLKTLVPQRPEKTEAEKGGPAPGEEAPVQRSADSAERWTRPPAEAPATEETEVATPPVRRGPRGVGMPHLPRRGGADGVGPTPGGGLRRPSRAFLVAATIGILLFLFAFLRVFQPFHGEGGDQVRVEIPKGAGVGEIGDLLDERGVVSSGFVFELRATLAGKRGALRDGSYALREDMSYGDAIEALTTAPEPAGPQPIDVTIPEGLSRLEVSRILRDTSVRGDYRRATRRSRVLDPRDYGAERARDLEGFLFPATYELRASPPASDLVAKQLTAFRREFRRVDMRAARRRNLTPYDVLIIASMVEREGQSPRDRRLIASVIHNRLREGIPLGIDATIRFATGNWTRPLRQSELNLDSPYNTRENQGLPPGPIGSPGIDAIRAAARPPRTSFLFFVARPGTCEHAFSRTDAEFQRDVQRYNRERQRRGGRSPTNCPE